MQEEACFNADSPESVCVCVCVSEEASSVSLQSELDAERQRYQNLLKEFSRLEQRYDNLKEEVSLNKVTSGLRSAVTSDPILLRGQRQLSSETSELEGSETQKPGPGSVWIRLKRKL